jgi:hypothetical protein
MTTKSWLAGVILVTTLIADRADATTALALTNRNLAEDASVIVTGHCVDLRTAWEGRTLVTVATVAVTDVIKGDPVLTVTVALPGGIDANRRFPIAMTYAGAPQMVVGEEVFLFLGEGDGITTGLTVLGFAQGKFSIVDDEQGEKAVSRNLSGLTLQSPAGTRRGTAVRIPLETFKNEIRGYLREP